MNLRKFFSFLHHVSYKTEVVQQHGTDLSHFSPKDLWYSTFGSTRHAILPNEALFAFFPKMHLQYSLLMKCSHLLGLCEPFQLLFISTSKLSIELISPMPTAPPPCWPAPPGPGGTFPANFLWRSFSALPLLPTSPGGPDGTFGAVGHGGVPDSGTAFPFRPLSPPSCWRARSTTACGTSRSQR